MPSLSPVELAVVAILALIVFGPQKLPEIARTVGRAVSELRRQATDLKAEFQDGLALDDEPEPDLPDEPETPAATEETSPPTDPGISEPEAPATPPVEDD